MSRLSQPEHFSTILEFAAGIADRGIPLSLVLVEPDGWSEAARSAGEDGRLDRLARHYADRVRRSDRITRLGTARFAALLVDCNRQGALIFADRLQAATRDGDDAPTSISCGIATWTREMSSHNDLLSAAEEALRRAQAAGGNGIELHGSPARR